MASSRRLALVLPVAVVAGLAVLVFLARDSAEPPKPLPSPPAADLAKDYDDLIEDSVMEVEEMLLDLSNQILRKAWGGALFHVAGDFEGSPFLREPEGEPRLAGGVALRSGGPDARRLDRAGFAGSMRELDLRFLLFKVPSAKLEGTRLVTKLKLDAQRADGGVGKRWVSTGEAEFELSRGRWLLRRFQGASIRTEEGPVRFHDVTGRLGLSMAAGDDDRSSTRVAFGRLFLGGIAAGDADGDGDVDLYVPQIGRNAYFRNDGGRFVECAAELGIDDPDSGASALFLDIDNDGDLDLLVSNFEAARRWSRETRTLVENTGRRALVLYENDGKGRFKDVTAAAGLATMGPAVMASAADVDRDGDLDVYVCMYTDYANEHPDESEEIPPSIFAARDGVANQLWINQGNGTFKEEAARRGVADTGWSLAASFADYDGDGDPDLYVSNMYSTAGNRILARGPGKLPEAVHRKLVKLAKGNTLFRNDGGTFRDVTDGQGVGPAGWAWSSAAYDFDNDGRRELYVANGFRTSEFATSDL